MAHLNDSIDPLDSKATLSEVIAKINEVIAQINHMWHPEDE